MALKYYIDYKDVVNIDHRFEIYDDAFAGTATQLTGFVVLDYVSVENPLEPIKGSGLRVNLEANQSLTFEDLYTEEQRTFKVIYKRDSVVKFNGWLNPEGWFEDFVNDSWVVSFDCVDGLSFLKDLSYVEDATGLPFTGKQTQLEVISNCLLRTGIQQNINVDIDIVYTGLSTSVCVLDNVNIIASRFIKDDNDTIMDCEEVLKSTLQPYAACITSLNGEWFIYKPNQLAGDSEMTYYRYDYTGAALSPATNTVDVAVDIGSEIDGFYPHHVSGNQKKSIKNSIGAYRISYRYGLVKSYLSNTRLLVSTGNLISDFTIVDAGGWTNDGVGTYGAYLTTDVDGADNLVLNTTDITIDSGIPVTMAIKGFASDDFNDRGFWKFYVRLNTSGSVFYLTKSGEWIESTVTPIEYNVGPGRAVNFNITTPPTPDAGDFSIRFYSPELYDPELTGELPSGNFKLTEVSLSLDDNIQQDIKGEFHTFQRTTKPSTKVKDVVEVSVGDNETDTYLGTFYKADTTTPTNTWNRIGKTESYPLLGIMGMEVLRMSPSPAIVFDGDVFGYLDYLSVVSINGLTGVFLPINYSYDTILNKITCKFIRIFNGELADIDYKITSDYGNVVKPTIKG